MTPTENKNGVNGHTQSPGMGIDDVMYTLFRHKWLILGSLCLGLMGVVAVRVVRPPLFVSHSELMVHYVQEAIKENALAHEEGAATRTEIVAQDILSSETRIIKSLDVAKAVAQAIGPERLLAKFGGGTNELAAAGVIYSGLEVDSPRGTAILALSFKHRDSELVQPVLKEVLQAYMKQHVLVRQGSGVREEYFKNQRDESLARLAQKEEALKKAKTEANVFFIEETKRSYETQIAKVQDELLDAQRDLIVRKAALGNPEVLSGGGTNANEVTIPAEKIDDYSAAITDLEFFKRQQRELLRQGDGEGHPAVQNARNQIDKATKHKAQLEREYPALTHVALSSSRGGTNAPGSDMAADLAEVKNLTGRVAALGTLLTNLQTQASRVLEAEPTIALLQKQRDEELKSFDFYANTFDKARAGQSQAGGQLISMGIVQNPTPPGLDTKKFMKLVGMLFCGCVGFGLALAFLMDLVFDRSIKRGLDIERHLQMPVFLTIPDTSWTSRVGLPWRSKPSRALAKRDEVVVSDTIGERALAPWSPLHHLQTYTEGLRERLMTYFDVNNMNLKKPKLVGVTGCGTGSGVSTLASGLAAALSKTGDGNVLLVDMNVGEGVAHSFYKGKPGCGISDVLAHEGRAEAQIQENLYLASINEENQEAQSKQPKALPVKFTNLVPKLKASDYDYIIFDLPPASPTSSTPRLASHMDITLLVVESEKTGQQVAARASRLMRESRANVAAVLNKFRPHVPARLSQEL